VLIAISDAGNISGKIVVDTSTVHPDTSSKASLDLSKAGAYFVAGMLYYSSYDPGLIRTAPVFGASPVAAAGQLLFIVAELDAATTAIALYMKGIMGRGVIALGEDASKASLMKTSG
jgi:3-hydroxyisobutyrate dehydrogenase-like beta-hydroxyacid dehydrogenase